MFPSQSYPVTSILHAEWQNQVLHHEHSIVKVIALPRYVFTKLSGEVCKFPSLVWPRLAISSSKTVSRDLNYREKGKIHCRCEVKSKSHFHKLLKILHPKLKSVRLLAFSLRLNVEQKMLLPGTNPIFRQPFFPPTQPTNTSGHWSH